MVACFLRDFGERDLDASVGSRPPGGALLAQGSQAVSVQTRPVGSGCSVSGSKRLGPRIRTRDASTTRRARLLLVDRGLGDSDGPGLRLECRPDTGFRHAVLLLTRRLSGMAEALSGIQESGAAGQPVGLRLLFCAPLRCACFQSCCARQDDSPAPDNWSLDERFAHLGKPARQGQHRLSESRDRPASGRSPGPPGRQDS